MPRSPIHDYRDPVDEIWIATARALGIEIVRSEAAYASYDGRGTLTISTGSELDRDDSLAQMILHELCHALVNGPGALQRVDFGLHNEDERDLVREHACHRLQAALAGKHGLRELMAVTTDHRPYWDALPPDPLAPGDDPAIELAREAHKRARGNAWGRTLDAALAATAKIAETARAFAPEGSLWHLTLPLHATGFPLHRDATRRCGSCAWAFRGGPGRPLLRCRQTRSGDSPAQRIAASAQACERFEPKLRAASCAPCGACCREGFDLVEVRPRDSIRRRHPELVREDRHGLHVPRPDGRCLALVGHGAKDTPYRCRIYRDRPRSCADFELGGDACLQARRRVGLSR